MWLSMYEALDLISSIINSKTVKWNLSKIKSVVSGEEAFSQELEADRKTEVVRNNMGKG